VIFFSNFKKGETQYSFSPYFCTIFWCYLFCSTRVRCNNDGQCTAAGNI